MTLYGLKPRFQALLRPMVRWIHRHHGTANQVTLAAALGSVLLGAALVSEGPSWPALYLLLPVWLFVRMALNAIDGLLAREHGQRSALGAYLNELCDPISDVALILPFAALAPFSAGSTVAVALLAVLSELAGVLGVTIGATRRYDGPMGKSDRALVFGLLGGWIGLAHPLPAWAGWAMPVLAALIAITVVQRVRRGLAEAAGSGRLTIRRPTES